ncbi:MAG TPA: efflux RND transporter periplasmic adaptor subunit, partial [Gammaproteobacteria bacterium]|nr:efflux RND transporter periplasmic adaptor subunit [Gammaproteobacteria bacterium]
MSDQRNPSSARFIVIGAATALLAAAGYGLYRLGMTHGEQIAGRDNATAPLKAGEVDPATGKRVLYWHDPMVPGQRFDQPGKSPFMNMQLVPVYEGASDSAIEVSARIRQNLGIRTAEVVRSTLTPQIEAAGNIAYDERDQVVVEVRADAFVEKLHVRATLDDVRAGQPLAELYVPAWVAVQEEFLAVLAMRGADTASLVDGARHRMRQAGMSEAQVRDVEMSGKAEPRVTLRAPIAGVVAE